MSNIQLVPVEFGANGMQYRQIKRNGRIAMYAVIGKAGKRYGSEVVILAVHPACSIMGRDYPDREVYPHNEDFGLTGWYYQSDEDAERRFRSLVSDQSISTPFAKPSENDSQ